MRPPCCYKTHIERGPWSEEEDAKILAHVAKHGTGNWTSVPKKAGLRRCGKSCRLRWTNYLRPEVKHESFSAEEEDLIIKLHAAIGSRWAIIAQQLPGRTDNDVKNYWNTKLKKKLTEKGIDPVTHRPFSQILRDYDSIGGIPAQSRAGSISKELKNAFYTGQGGGFSGRTDYYSMPQAAVKPEPPESCYSMDLLAQLQAIKLVTDGSSWCSLPSPSSTSSSSSSICSTAQECFSWSEFLLEETNPSPNEQEKAGEFMTEGSALQSEAENAGGQKQMGDGVIYCPDNGGFNGTCLRASPSSPSSSSSFVEDMLKRDGDMFMEFPELWEEPHY